MIWIIIGTLKGKSCNVSIMGDSIIEAITTAQQVWKLENISKAYTV